MYDDIIKKRVIEDCDNCILKPGNLNNKENDCNLCAINVEIIKSIHEQAKFDRKCMEKFKNV